MLYDAVLPILCQSIDPVQKGFSEDVTLDQLQTFFDTFGKVRVTQFVLLMSGGNPCSLNVSPCVGNPYPFRWRIFR